MTPIVSKNTARHRSFQSKGKGNQIELDAVAFFFLIVDVKAVE
jgi:hypothetical protein